MDIRIKELPEECPFCHEIPVVVKDPLWQGSHGYYRHYSYYVACKNKDCKVQPVTKAYYDLYNTEQECIDMSIKDWNTR